jgi:hypothetical protein
MTWPIYAAVKVTKTSDLVNRTGLKLGEGGRGGGGVGHIIKDHDRNGKNNVHVDYLSAGLCNHVSC